MAMVNKNDNVHGSKLSNIISWKYKIWESKIIRSSEFGQIHIRVKKCRHFTHWQTELLWSVRYKGRLVEHDTTGVAKGKVLGVKHNRHDQVNTRISSNDLSFSAWKFSKENRTCEQTSSN